MGRARTFLDVDATAPPDAPIRLHPDAGSGGHEAVGRPVSDDEAVRIGPEGPGLFRLVAVALLTCALALLVYGLVDWTGTFDLDRIEVTGAPPEIIREVQAALAPLEGESLVSIGSAHVQSLAQDVPYVLAARIERDFPSALKVKLVLHRPVAVVRSGAGAWVVSSRGHVLEAVKPAALPALPRVWIPAGADPEPGDVLQSSTALAAARAIGRLPQPFPLRVVSARGSVDDLTLIVGQANGIEVRLGEAEALRLKLEVAASVLRSLSRSEAAALAYLDVSVPERPVGSRTPAPQ